MEQCDDRFTSTGEWIPGARPQLVLAYSQTIVLVSESSTMRKRDHKLTDADLYFPEGLPTAATLRHQHSNEVSFAKASILLCDL
jgi:hypothetical protein